MLTSIEDHQLLVFWTQLFVLLLAARLLGALMRRIGQPAVIGELAAGLVLGPSVFGKVWPSGFDWFLPRNEVSGAMLLTIGWIGVALLLVVTGFETDLVLISRFRKAASFVIVGSLVLPFVIGLLVGWKMPGSFLGDGTDRLVFALFMAAALSISSLPVIAKVLSELDMLRRNFGQITLAAGMANDLIGWLVLGVIAGLASSGSVSVSGFGATLIGMALFLLVSMTVGQRVVDAMLRRVRQTDADLAGALSVTLLVVIAAAALTQAIGVEAVLGTFVAGIVLGRSRFQVDDVLGRIEGITQAFFAPIFFATAGLRVDLTVLSSPENLLWTAIVLLVASIGKFAGAYVGARSAHLSNREGLALGAGLNARGALEIVIATIGLSLGVLNAVAYTAVVLMAIATSIMAPPTLRLIVRGWRGTSEEQRRLHREKTLAANVVVKPQRMLLPSRGGPNSIAAAQILHFAWPEEVAATVLSVVDEDGHEPDVQPVLNVLADREVDQQRVSNEDAIATISAETKLGYGVIGVGARDSQQAERLLSPVVDDLLLSVDIPVVIVRRARHLVRPLPAAFSRAIVPVTGTRASRAAQELAFNLSAALGTDIVLTHVVDRPAEEPALAAVRARSEARSDGPIAAGLTLDAAAGVLTQAVELARGLGLEPSTLVRNGRSAAEEIIDLAGDVDADLIVLGATPRRLGERPFLGHNVEHVLANSPATVVVVTLPAEAPPA